MVITKKLFMEYLASEMSEAECMKGAGHPDAIAAEQQVSRTMHTTLRRLLQTTSADTIRHHAIKAGLHEAITRLEATS